MNYFYLLLLIISLLFVAVLASADLALSFINQLNVDGQPRTGTHTNKFFNRILKKNYRFREIIWLGFSIGIVCITAFSAHFTYPWLLSYSWFINNQALTVFVQAIIGFSLVYLFIALLPLLLFSWRPSDAKRFMMAPMIIIYYMLYPLYMISFSLTRFIGEKIFNIKPEEMKLINKNFPETRKMPEGTKKQLEEPDHAARILTNALEFKTVRIRECMIPRTEVVAVDVEDGIEALREAFVESGHSKIIVYRDSIDDVIGYCHAMELFKKPKEIQTILTPIIIVPETMLANELLVQFITEHKSLALVVDEFGGTSGIVSMEDLIEQIFGDIQDEHDEEEWVEQQLNENNFILSARHEIDYLNEKYDLDLPLGDYDTLGGYILSVTENIPNINDVVETELFTFTIMSMQDNRIDIVKLTIKEDLEEE